MKWFVASALLIGSWWIVASESIGINTNKIPLPTSTRQVKYQQTPLRTFHHFGICTFAGCEHNTGSGSWGSGNASQFNPAHVDVEQWVIAAKEFGAGGAVLTARHEGGFCLFPSKYTDYSIQHSPLAGRDLVREFIDACNKHNIKPSLYFAASCDGYHKNGDPLSIADYVNTQKKILIELVTTYTGIEYVWFDHHGNPPGHNKSSSRCTFFSGCICDPLVNTFWYDVDALMRKYAPNVLVGGTDIGIGQTFATPPFLANHFNTCDLNDPHSTANNASRCHTAIGNDVFGNVYRPYEITATAATSELWFWHNGTEYLSADTVVSQYYSLVGNGFNYILNFPPNASGVLDDTAVSVMQTAGSRINDFYNSEISRVSGMCKTGMSITLSLPQQQSTTLAGIMLMEDLALGQRVTAYNVHVSTSTWSTSDLTIGQRRIYNVTPPVRLDANTNGSMGASVIVTCTSVVGSANITIVAFSQPPK